MALIEPSRLITTTNAGHKLLSSASRPLLIHVGDTAENRLDTLSSYHSVDVVVYMNAARVLYRPCLSKLDEERDQSEVNRGDGLASEERCRPSNAFPVRKRLLNLFHGLRHTTPRPKEVCSFL